MKNCVVCGKDLIELVGHAAKGNHKLCSLECKHKRIKEQYTGYNNINYAEAREKRKNLVCEYCGKNVNATRGDKKTCNTNCYIKLKILHRKAREQELKNLSTEELLALVKQEMKEEGTD